MLWRMRRTMLRVAIVGGLATGLLLLSPAPQGFSQPQAAADAAKGKTIFADNCAFCHNAESNEALVGPGLKDLFKWPAHKMSDGTEHKEHTVEIIKKQVSEGGGAMAPMGETVNGQALDDLIAYLQTL